MTSGLALRWRIATGIILFAGFELFLVSHIDRPLARYLWTVDASHPLIIDFFRFWTDLGKGKWYLFPSGLFLIVLLVLARWPYFPEERRRRFSHGARILGFFFLCVSVSGLLTNFLKRLIGRARPVLLEREDYYGFDPFIFQSAHHSMPSGHTTTAFAVAFSLMMIWPWARPWLLMFAFALAVSRVMVNAHYLSDIVAGAAVGILTVLFFRWLFYRCGWTVRAAPAPHVNSP